MQSNQLTEIPRQRNQLDGGDRLIDRFRNKGITISEWALQRGYNRQLVYMIARGERKCLRGKSFRIAQELQAM